MTDTTNKVITQYREGAPSYKFGNESVKQTLDELLDLDLQVFAFSQLLAHLARSGAHLLVFLKPTKCFWWNYQNKRINTNKVHFL